MEVRPPILSQYSLIQFQQDGVSISDTLKAVLTKLFLVRKQVWIVWVEEGTTFPTNLFDVS